MMRPLSRASISASSLAWSATTSANRRRCRARAKAGKDRQWLSNVWPAATTASAMSRSPLRGTPAQTRPVEGSTLSSTAPEAADCRSSPMTF